jgi:hypothetical protein
VLYQLSYGRPLRRIGRTAHGQGRDRTADTTIFSRVLYQLSYLASVLPGRATKPPPNEKPARLRRRGLAGDGPDAGTRQPAPASPGVEASESAPVRRAPANDRVREVERSESCISGAPCGSPASARIQNSGGGI